MIIPEDNESFFRYCKELEQEIMGIEFLNEEVIEEYQATLLNMKEKYTILISNLSYFLIQALDLANVHETTARFPVVHGYLVQVFLYVPPISPPPSSLSDL